MKQHITVEQLNELSNKGKEKLREWWKPTVGDMVQWYDTVGPLTDNGEGMWDDLYAPDWNKDKYLPLLSIGQIIEYLYESGRVVGYGNEGWSEPRMEWQQRNGDLTFEIDWEPGELCDSLWQAVKEDLEK